MASEDYEPTSWERISPQVYGFATILMNAAFVAAGLSLIYLLFGLFSGQLAAQSAADQQRIAPILNIASQMLTVGLAVGTLCAVFITFGEDAAGYIILGGAAAVGLGIPFAYVTFNSNVAAAGVQKALTGLQFAAYVPAALGLLLVVKDVGAKFGSAVKKKPLERESFQYGSDAKAERLPVRTSLFAKCWEGPFCREFIRPRCPIFIKRQACWKVRSGCYCEEDIIVAASQKAQGVPLTMAPDPKYNFANPPTPGARRGGMVPPPPPPPGGGLSGMSPAAVSEIGPGDARGLGTVGSLGAVGSAPLPITIGDEYHPPMARRHELTMAQKRERCRNCVIYNEHQREKYKILMPVALIGGIVLCAVFAPLMREGIGSLLGGAESLTQRIAFNSNVNPKFNRPPSIMEWSLVGAFSLMIVSKVLQTLEWACFKAKI